MLDVIHLIVTVLSDHPSRSADLVSSVKVNLFDMLLYLSNGMDAMLSGGLAKGRWAVLGMVTEGGDLSS